jgi:hypothetical protein
MMEPGKLYLSIKTCFLFTGQVFLYVLLNIFPTIVSDLKDTLFKASQMAMASCTLMTVTLSRKATGWMTITLVNKIASNC